MRRDSTGTGTHSLYANTHTSGEGPARPRRCAEACRLQGVRVRRSSGALVSQSSCLQGNCDASGATALGTLQRNEQSVGHAAAKQAEPMCVKRTARPSGPMSAPAPRGGRTGAARPTPRRHRVVVCVQAYTLARNSFRKSSYAREGHHVLSQLFDWQRFIYHSFYCSTGSW